MSDYEITKKDIEAVVRYLEIYHPENANEEFAAQLLEATKAGIHQFAADEPEKIEELYTKVLNSNSSES